MATSAPAPAPAAELQLLAAPPGEPAAGPLVFVGSRSRLGSPAVAALVPEGARAVWASLLDAAVGSADTGGSATTFVARSGGAGGGALKVTACVLPSACSRHNSAAQPHAVSALVGAVVGGGPASVVAAVPPDHRLATAAALARALPLFTLKSAKPAKDGAATTSPERPVVSLALLADADEPAATPAELARLAVVADAVRFAARLVDTPPEEMGCDAVAAEAAAVASRCGPAVTLVEIKGTDLRDRGFGGLWGVGKAAAQAPRLVVLSYAPAGGAEPHAAQPPAALVGKGIVYDTGGLSLKVGGGMCGMKMDLGGCAAVLAAFEGAVRLGCPRPLHALLCVAENAIGPGAVRNDDVLRMLSGKTVEINNTDAEARALGGMEAFCSSSLLLTPASFSFSQGRLVLGDGVAYATSPHHLPGPVPSLVVDVATLTGAQLVATGKRHGAVVANSAAGEALALGAGLRSGDLLHALPFCPEFYRSEFASKVADLKNSVKDRANAQSSCAATFVHEHLHPEWKARGDLCP